jgi:uncharacterized membrane protein YdbT with pleckstrin-like domain
MEAKTYQPARTELIINMVSNLLCLLFFLLFIKVTLSYFLPVSKEEVFDFILLQKLLYGMIVFVFGGIGVSSFCYIVSESFTFDDEKIVCKRGIFWKKTVTIPFSKITSIDTSQSPLQRIFFIGDIGIQTAGSDIRELNLHGVDGFEVISRQLIKLTQKNKP